MSMANTLPSEPGFLSRLFKGNFSWAQRGLDLVGMGWLIHLAKLITGHNRAEQLDALKQKLLIPLLGISIFVAGWAVLAPQVKTSLGVIPGPVQVWEQVGKVAEDHRLEKSKAAAFYERQEARNQKLIADGKSDKVKVRQYTGKPTFLNQILTSLVTVALGFIIATVVAVPLGLACGLSKNVQGAINPLIQIFKPVSPLAWLPIVTMVVSAMYVNPSDWLPKSMLISAITVTLCSLWPTLVNTTVGVASVDKDLINVSRVLKLSTGQSILKVVLPSALPLMFTGLRLSLGVGWMVLIAAEMLAQNPGLGKFVWDEFQNGSSDSLAKIMMAVLVIGIIGFILDRIMYSLQQAFTLRASS
ncbi:MAG: ABC transporter permease [Gammaproteobacteria bacterium]|nr:ABC transporter permease [Gammaproteobacteria bacterium]